MAEYIEIGGHKIDKKKALILGAGGAGLIGLLYMFSHQSDAGTTYDGITGYPDVTSEDASDVVSSGADLSTLADQLQDFRDQQQQQIDAQRDYINTIVDKLNADTTRAAAGDAVTLQTDRQFMSASKVLPGEAAPTLNDSNIQAQINNAILSGAGASTINTLNAQRDAKISSTGRTASVSNTYYDKNTDYSTLIQAAQSQGASQAVINNLTAMRQAKINAVYGGVDPKPRAVLSGGSSSATNVKTSAAPSSSGSSSATNVKTSAAPSSGGSSSSGSGSSGYATVKIAGTTARKDNATGAVKSYSKQQGWH